MSHRATFLSARLIACLALAVSGGACCTDTASSPVRLKPGSFSQLQATIITPTCATAGCHSQGSPFAQSSGLVLDARVAYQNLVNVQPKNAAARAAGLMRVRPGQPD